MRITRSFEFHIGSKEEKLSYFAPNFPYIASRAELDYYNDSFVPWHWHKAVELFYMESGELKYYTPNRIMVFPAGSGGMINSNVLHMTKIQTHNEKNIQLLHIFEPDLIAGKCGSLIEQKYITPIITASQLEIIALYPDNPAQAAILHLIQQTFQLSENEFGYELNIRESLSQIWIQLLKLCSPTLQEKSNSANKTTDKIKRMMIYIHEHYAEKISISKLAATAFLSERECYRVFHNYLHDATRIHKKLPFTNSMSNVSRWTCIGNRNWSYLRIRRCQLFWENFSQTYRMYAIGISPKMAE